MLTAATCRLRAAGSSRRTAVVSFNGQPQKRPPLIRPPPDRPGPQRQQSPGRGGGGGGRGGGRPPPASTAVTPLSRVLDAQNKLWLAIKRQVANKDSRGIATAPAVPGSVGQPIKLLTNHLLLQASPAFRARPLYRVTVTQQDTDSEAAGPDKKTGGSSNTGEPVMVALEERQQLLAELARQQGWPADGWLYEPSANVLYARQPTPDLACSEAVQLPGQGGGGSGKVGRGTKTTYQITVAAAPQQGGTSGGAQELQLLGLLLRSFWPTALPASAIHAPPNILTKPAELASSAPAWASARGGARGGGRGGSRGGGRGGGRTGRRSPLGFLQIFEGFRLGVKRGQPGSADLMLQLDSTARGVVPVGNLADLLTSALPPGTSLAELCGNERLLAEAAELAKGVQVTVGYMGSGPRLMTVRGLDARSPAAFSFMQGSSSTTVAEYFRRQYNVTLRHPDWPCVMISKTAAIPLELCRVDQPHLRKTLTEAQTAELIKVAALPPGRRLQAITELAATLLSSAKTRLLQLWGIGVEIAPMQVDGRILPDAQLQYGGDVCLAAANTGQWRAPQSTPPLQACRLTSWALVNLAGAGCSAGVSAFVSELQKAVRAQGSTANAPASIITASSSSPQEAQAAVRRAAAACRQQPPQLVVVVLPDSRGSSLYNAVKAAAAALAIPSQCMLASKAGISGASPAVKPPYVANLLLKIGAKLGATNWSLPPGWAGPAFSRQQLMVLGIDVTHGGMAGGGPSSGSSKPSVAAVVGSVDARCSRYAAAVSQQTPGHEIVLGLQEATRQLLRQRQRGGLPAPQSLLVYRDGVSDSQFLAVLQQEVSAIRQACRDELWDAAQPKITFIVVSKSHGTRLFPAPGGRADSSGNCVPGTCVDTLITQPTAFEFFINSHSGIQGTNRPARYNVLVDDHDAGPDTLQVVTQALCSIYHACTRTISHPAPVRYADKAAALADGITTAAGGGWLARVVVRPATGGGAGSPAAPELWYGLLPVGQDVPGMWFV